MKFGFRPRIQFPPNGGKWDQCPIVAHREEIRIYRSAISDPSYVGLITVRVTAPLQFSLYLSGFRTTASCGRTWFEARKFRNSDAFDFCPVEMGGIVRWVAIFAFPRSEPSGPRKADRNFLGDLSVFCRFHLWRRRPSRDD